MKNLDLDGEFSSSSNGSFLAGRTRGSTVVIENVVLKATLNGKAGDTGLFVGGSDKSSLTVKNVLIKSTNATSLCKLGSEPTTLVTEKYGRPRATAATALKRLQPTSSRKAQRLPL